MGKQLFCDMCGASVPIESNFTTVKFGEDVVAELCVNCNLNLKNSIVAAKSDVIKMMAKPAVPAKQEKPPEATPHVTSKSATAATTP